MDGPWRITVIGKDAAFDQRAVIRASYGTSVLSGRVGEFLDVREDEWELELEHSWDGRWWPNVRVRPGPVQSLGSGARTREIRSKDADWTGGHPDHPNFVLRLDSLETTAPRAGESAGAAPEATGRAAVTGIVPGVLLSPAARAGAPMAAAIQATRATQAIQAIQATRATPPATAGAGVPAATQMVRTSSGPAPVTRRPAEEPERAAAAGQAGTAPAPRAARTSRP